MANEERLRKWQERLRRSEAAYEGCLGKMDRREKIYRGDRTLLPRVAGDRKRRAAHVRNLTAELIEAQVNSSIPKPKVTAVREADEGKAKLIEDMLRNELDRLPMEQLNDMMERTVPIQGGACFLVEWDNRKRTHTSVGELSVSVLHPKQVIPQAGVYTGVEDMDYVILRLPQTRESILRKYGVDVTEEGEDAPEVRSHGQQEDGEDMVTQYTAYYRNPKGGVGLYSWVNDIELEDLEDYQARRVRRCEKCGEPEPPEGAEKCPRCGNSKWQEHTEEEEPLPGTLRETAGSAGAGPEGADPIRAEEEGVLPGGRGGKIPCYKPELFPVILQKNVSVFGQLLGDSDVDKIEDQQNTANRIESKIIEKLVKSGSYLILPDDASIRADAEDMKVIRPGSPAAAQIIGVKDMEGNISQDLAYLSQVYEEARQIIGITDSFQGRRDTTATSGKAKEFSASQAAGRLESKRVMKDAAYAKLFEAMFKFKLAYADEARPVLSKDPEGKPVYQEFDRYDFLEKDDAGEYYWNDRFLFSCDTTAPLAANREAMWQETRQNLQSGAFGDPKELSTLILFWSKMEMLHYPGAGETRSYLERRLQDRSEQESGKGQTALSGGPGPGQPGRAAPGGQGADPGGKGEFLRALGMASGMGAAPGQGMAQGAVPPFGTGGPIPGMASPGGAMPMTGPGEQGQLF